ncbi:transporter, outer membrane receptor (OMR) family [Hyphomonas neptunium ATCC 15444]|uniref:Transporter, outer membrane receptor (OMR) family n=2 Tax=Hyphomonas TaxID=85 RepID=Q0BZ11_HYPNA|nr:MULTISPECIES: TonB-dependent receptor [Hyphomonas]ABI78190.1 transporter, outer membrane receptor (OMR) family [Hyphomonas neptunium ATCC 15444]KCZ87278.1 outer membrane receptor (OMR) family protein [Hyphomonas hirschiana VP5]
MEKNVIVKSLLNTCALAALASALIAPLGVAQEQDEPAATLPVTEDETATLETVVITGSRIRRDVASTPAPVVTFGEAAFEERGLVSAGDALNEITSLRPQLNQAAGDGTSSGSGQQYPELFGLGTGRTLTLVNGRRFATTSSGLGDAQVDANIIPTGLISRIEVVQAGGAAVYGSDAIAGVVNYILKDDFDGVELDLQYGDNELGNYEQITGRITAGKNFGGGRGNVALNLEASTTPVLRFSDFPESNRSRITQGNPDDTGPDDGIPSLQEVIPAYFWNFNGNGVIFNAPAPPPFLMTTVNGAPAQFAPDGSVIPYNPGNILGIPFAEGGDGTRYSDLAGLRTGVERFTGNLIGHYDISDNLRLNTELLYAQTTGESVPQGYARTVLNQTSPSLGAIMFTRNNPFLTQSAIDTLSAANPGFGAGAPLWLSRNFYNGLFPDNVQENETTTWRALAGLEGDFDAAGRNFYWSASASYADVSGEESFWDANFANFNRAVNAVSDGAGGIVCAINADADTTNDDPSCAPLNPFGAGNISEAASRYVSARNGFEYNNEQVDLLATIGTQLFTLPAGAVDVVLAYEHRREEASFTPFEANQLGLVGTGSMEEPSSGKYNTNEYSAEVLVPIIGGDLTLPGVQALDVSGTYRFVDNSIAGEESVWSLGSRWEVTDGVTFRVTRSRNFRAPTLEQLFAPQSTVLANGGFDPCDADRIDAGPNPATRRANCEAEWAANPQYGDLATFQNPAENFSVTSVLTGGNADLLNEVSETTTFGVVLDNFIVPGLTVAADRIEIDLTDGLSAFTTADFMATCYDSTPQPAAICSAFTRLQAADGSDPAGTTATGRTTTFNAGEITFRGEVYYVNYGFDLNDLFSGATGDVTLGLEATHMAKLNTSVTGTSFTRSDNTVQRPDWTARFNAAYSTGPLRLSYQMDYLDDVLARPDATIENDPNPEIDANYVHSLSALYELREGLTLRAGVTNMFDEGPSYPTFVHGDILGRRYFAGVNYRF